ncbi:MAG: hypothetical protein COW71_04445 [Ignavibacteriales bacterium CG18_big_fil_WC_8_21_14_2_50_31_20]|nr:MAG: hypothetical protein COW71_04445 [Ignavibacteriales bacterium CG18_big_fil_WC_8_21_14_2_50_31_20]
MADDAVKEMISAFALGCMDKSNFKQFRDYFEHNGKLPKGELGDLQNIIALIPTILDIDLPDPDVKNELGKRLIQIQKDMKEGIIENRRETRIKGTANFVQRDSSTKIFDVSEKRIQAPNNIPVEDSPKQKTLKTLPKKENITRLNITQPQQKASNRLSIVFIWAFLVFIIVALVVFYNSFSNAVDILNSSNLDLANKISKLRTDLVRTEDFVNQNIEFIEFFNNPNIELVNLKGINPNSKESGKLFVSLGSGEGLLQLQNMPHLEAEMSFQLWLVSKAGTFSLGAFEIRPDKKYIKFSQIPYVIREDIEMFRITKESKGGSIAPTSETILFGALQNEIAKAKNKRR